MEVPRVGRKWGMVLSSALMGVALALVRLQLNVECDASLIILVSACRLDTR